MSNGTDLAAPTGQVREAHGSRIVRCRYLCRDGNRCSAEAIDPRPDVIAICGKHAARVLVLVRDKQAELRKAAS